jgi:hypothetical protein
MPAREKADVRMHAELGLDVRAHVGRPAEAGRIDDALDASVAGARDVDLGSADFLVVGALDRRGERIHWRLA